MAERIHKTRQTSNERTEDMKKQAENPCTRTAKEQGPLEEIQKELKVVIQVQESENKLKTLTN